MKYRHMRLVGDLIATDYCEVITYSAKMTPRLVSRITKYAKLVTKLSAYGIEAFEDFRAFERRWGLRQYEMLDERADKAEWAEWAEDGDDNAPDKSEEVQLECCAIIVGKDWFKFNAFIKISDTAVETPRFPIERLKWLKAVRL